MYVTLPSEKRLDSFMLNNIELSNFREPGMKS